MRFYQHINKENFNSFNNLLVLCESLAINERYDKVFYAIRDVGDKLGLKVIKSNTLVDLLAKAGSGVDDIIRLAALYLITDIKDSKSRADIVAEVKNVIRHLNVKNLMSFLMQLDKLTFGLTSHLRHIIQSVFGIEITTYNNWEEDHEYLRDEIKNMYIVLKRMGNTDKEIKALKSFETSILGMK